MIRGCSLLNNKSICEGCLSVDRKLIPIYHDESRSVFNYLIDSPEHISHNVMLCWECDAIVHKFIRFRKQVQTARDHLVTYMLQQIISPPLTRLHTKETNIIHDYVHADIDSKNDAKPQTGHIANIGRTNNSVNNTQNSINNTQNLINNTQNSINNTENSVNESLNYFGGTENTVEPVTFIKIETLEDDFPDNDIERLFIDDNGHNGVDERTDKDFETILKSDHYKYEKPKTSRKTTQNAEVEFNESDEEPLKKIKEDKEKKPRGRRKKKEVEGEQTDCPKRRRKREQPAGVVNNARVAEKLRRLNVPSGELEMVLLTWEEVEAERQKAMSSVAFTRHEYRCHDCVIGFNHRFKLENHMKKHDPSAGAWSCAVCGVRSRSRAAWAAHRRRHRVRWRCARCGAACSRAATAADHLARHRPHHHAHRHACRVCGETLATLGKLRSHLMKHAERQKCEQCGKTFRDRTSLRTHLFIHRGEKEYACPHCEKRFLFKKAMEVHLVTHEAPEQLYCHQCDMNFKNGRSYYQHTRYSLRHIDPSALAHVCPTCGKRFAKAARLREHDLAVHLKVTPLQCDVQGCSFACASRSSLRSHVRATHRGQRSRNHVCHTCGKAYTTKKTLEGHLRSHTGERPFKCALCPSTFGYEAALYNHNKLVHLKIKSGRGRSTAVPAVPASAPETVNAPPTASWQLDLQQETRTDAT